MKPDFASGQWPEQPLDWARHGGHAEQLLAAIGRRQKARMRRRLVGATLALVIAGLAWFTSLPRVSPGSAVVSLPRSKAVVTEPLRQSLPDGSVVELKPGAELAVHFSAGDGGSRRVALKAGEAHFQVAKDAARPFLVEAGGVVFRAVGTAFAVDFTGSSVEMIVTEGTVAVDRSFAPPAIGAGEPSRPGMLALVQEGNRVRLALSDSQIAPKVEPLTPAEADAKLAWRVPRLEFNETPLAEVARLINQHAGTRIRLGSPELGRVEISGSLRANNIDALLHMLEANYHIEAVRGAAGAIELKR